MQKIRKQINATAGEKEINAIVSLLRRWCKKNDTRAFVLRMYQKNEWGIFIEDDNAGHPDNLHALVETFLYDEADSLHIITEEELKLGPLEERNLTKEVLKNE